MQLVYYMVLMTLVISVPAPKPNTKPTVSIPVMRVRERLGVPYPSNQAQQTISRNGDKSPVVETDHRVELICFGAKWCGPCQKVKPILGRLHQEGFPVFYNDIDQYPRMAKTHNVTSVPHWVLRVDGKEVESFRGGGIGEGVIRSWFVHINRVFDNKAKWSNIKLSRSRVKSSGRIYRRSIALSVGCTSGSCR